MNALTLSRSSSGASRIGCTVLLLLLAFSARAELRLPEPQGLQQIGSGTLRWLGFHVYDASTWADVPALPRDGSVPAPFALQIVYAREISAKDLVSATESAWDDLGLLDDKANSWLPQLQQLWPDVKPGDTLVLHIDDARQARFYYNGKLLGSVADQEFGPRFAAIWLHPDSSESTLRRQLLGERS
ncbi:MAG TPA: chalcone isomerase family protein [Permianibacter sp.]|nr:chalcone isomerase family protein [Permianibacter sp.]